MADLPQPSLDETIEFSVAGRRFAMSGAEVLAKARQAIRQGVPPSAQTYLAWAVAVDGQLVGLKWLFSLATGLPRSTFVSNQALYSFERMGLDVQRVADVPAPGQGERQALGEGTGHDERPLAVFLRTRLGEDLGELGFLGAVYLGYVDHADDQSRP